jgi:hypothetical protein
MGESSEPSVASSLVAEVYERAEAYQLDTDPMPDDEDIDRSALTLPEIDRAVEWRLELETVVARARVVQRYRNTVEFRSSGADCLEDLVGTPSQLESTYVKAKQGAVEQGDQIAAGQFFTLERVFAREQHWRRPLKDRGESSAVAAKDWLGNVLLSVFTGYGEKPQLVFGWAILTIIGFAGAFYLVRDSFATTPPYGSELGYLLVSLGSFVTMVLDAPMIHEHGTDVLWLSGIEGFIGVSFVALIVFTLTRSIHR